MKIVKILTWILRIVVLALLVVLIIDNRQTATFNFFGIYSVTLPLIIIALIFMVLGIIIGGLISLFKRFELKARISMLEKELKKSTFIPTVKD